jgi:hypothetical protein
VVFQKKQPKTADKPPKADSRFSRFGDDDLVAAVEASLSRSAEVFRGFTNAEVDTDWVVSELETQLVIAYSAVRAIRDRRELGFTVK